MPHLHARTAFGLLVLAQAAHSVEEYRGRLWQVFPPATFVTGLVSSNHQLGFILLNVAIVVFGVWCFLWPVSRRWPSASSFITGWAIVETMNGLGHPLWSLLQGGYTPGVLTAPLLLVLGPYAALRAWRDYSARSATVGSTAAARRAGR